MSNDILYGQMKRTPEVQTMFRELVLQCAMDEVMDNPELHTHEEKATHVARVVIHFISTVIAGEMETIAEGASEESDDEARQWLKDELAVLAGLKKQLEQIQPVRV